MSSSPGSMSGSDRLGVDSRLSREHSILCLKGRAKRVTVQGRGIQRGGRQAERVADGTFLALLLERGCGQTSEAKA